VDGVDSLAAAVVFLGAGAWIAWLLVGTLVNRRRAAAVSRWLYAEARPFGERLYIRWITLAAFELTVPEARAPFQQLSLTGFLESREMPFVWLWNRLRGRGDLLVVRADLRHPPRWGLEVYRADGLLAGDARRAALAAGWTPLAGADGREYADGGAGAAALRARALAALDIYAPHVERLALRQEAPQLILTLAIGWLRPATAPPLGPPLRRLAEVIAADG
jgi:hypothetical protein